MSSLTNALFLRLHILVPLGVYRWTHALRVGEGGGGGWGNFPVWLTRYVPLCKVEVYGIFNLEKKYSISPFSVLNRVAILMHFALSRVRIEGFQKHSPN